VTYSEFFNQVQRGDVEIVRVQNDLLAAQYTSKDGSRHEVNLVPNGQVEDALFNQLAERKVDVTMQGSNANNGGPLDFLARFAAPIAWLIAALLLSLAVLALAPPGRAGRWAGTPFQLGKSPAKVVKDGDTKVKFGDVAGCDGAKEELVEVHAKDKSLAPSVDLSAVAQQTPDMSGADLANLLNEGAIVAARQNKMEIDQDNISNALERIMIG